MEHIARNMRGIDMCSMVCATWLMTIDGKQLAQKILADLKLRVAKLGFTPLFCDVLVGDDPVSLSYVNIKGKTAKAVGLDFKIAAFPDTITTEALVQEIQALNQESHMAGLIVQLPLPPHIDRDIVLDAIDPRIDVDGIGKNNTELFYDNKAQLVPPTAAAIIHILDSLQIDLSGKHFLVIGQGELVGKPITHLLRQRGYHVVTGDHATENLASIIPHSDVVISGTGQPKLIYGSMVKPGAVVIDAGTAESSGGIVGDVDFESVSAVAGYVSPVPGGVGPVTVAKLLENVVRVAEINTHPSS